MTTSLIIFCSMCHCYLGIASFCKECEQERHPAHHLPEPNQPLWQVDNGKRPFTQPIHYQGIVYTAVSPNHLAAYQAATGELLWTVDIGGRSRRKMALADGRLYAGTRAGSLAVVNLENGRFETSYTLSAKAGSPLIDRKTVYIGNTDGNVYALRLEGSGWKELWRTPLNLRMDNAPAKIGGLILVATRHWQGDVVALDAHRGQIVWRTALEDRLFAPVVAGGRAIIGTQGGGIIAFSPSRYGFEEVWRYSRQAEICTPAADEERVYIGDAAGGVTAVSLANGRILWQKELESAGTISGITAWEGLLFVGTHRGGLIALDAENGAFIWQWGKDDHITTPPTVGDGVVYAGGKKTGLFALPWHLGQWQWAAEWSERKGWIETAASFYALAGRRTKAHDLWIEVKKGRLAAHMWLAQGKHLEAAHAFRITAEHKESANPMRASGLWSRAAEQYRKAGDLVRKDKCRRKAASMGKFALLEIQPFNFPLFEAGIPGQVGFRLHNWGNDKAVQVHFDLGGQLYKVTRVDFDYLQAGQTAVVTIDNLIPTRAGEQELIVSLSYGGGRPNGDVTLHKWTIEAAPPPPGLITVQGDAGAVIVRVPKGTERPSIRVNGDVGMVRVV